MCSLYSGDLAGAVAGLEAQFRDSPGAALCQEGAVLNLASLYELSACGGSVQDKRRLGAWVAAAAPDDFDLSATKSPGGGGGD